MCSLFRLMMARSSDSSLTAVEAMHGFVDQLGVSLLTKEGFSSIEVPTKQPDNMRPSCWMSGTICLKRTIPSSTRQRYQVLAQLVFFGRKWQDRFVSPSRFGSACLSPSFCLAAPFSVAVASVRFCRDLVVLPATLAGSRFEVPDALGQDSVLLGSITSSFSRTSGCSRACFFLHMVLLWCWACTCFVAVVCR